MPQGMTASMNSMGQVDDGSFSKQASTVMAGLADMYKQAHIQDAGGPLASQLQMLMNAVAEAEAEYMGAGIAPPDPEGAVPVGDEMPMEEGAMPTEEGAMPMGAPEMDPDAIDAEAAGAPPTSMEDAGMQLEEMLKTANARKR